MGSPLEFVLFVLGDIDGAVWASAVAGAILIGTLILAVMVSVTATGRMSRNFHDFLNVWGQSIRETGELINDLRAIANAMRGIVTEQRSQIEGAKEHAESVRAQLSSMHHELIADGAQTRRALDAIRRTIERW